MNAVFSLSGSFGSIYRSQFSGNNNYTGIESNLCSKPTPLHVPVHKSELKISYSSGHFSLLSQADSEVIIKSLSNKISDASLIIDLIINGFSPNKVSKKISYL